MLYVYLLYFVIFILYTHISDIKLYIIDLLKNKNILYYIKILLYLTYTTR